MQITIKEDEWMKCKDLENWRNTAREILNNHDIKFTKIKGTYFEVRTKDFTVDYK